MNIGLQYNIYNDIAIILYALQHDDIILDDYQSILFKIKCGEDTYCFSRLYNDIVHCDKKILTVNNLNNALTKREVHYDKIVLSQTQDDFFVPVEVVNVFLQKGNVCLSANLIHGVDSYEHENFLYDPILNLVVIYYLFGYQFLNYHKFDKKDHLLGVYKQKLHIDGTPRGWRDYMFNEVKTILGDDFFTYPKKEYIIRELIEPPYRCNLWSEVKMSGYTDYTTSVCNLVFETDGPYAPASHISEKTLKAIIFCEENIFFILCCPTYNFKKLHETGFWFLNSEFYDFTVDNLEEMANSIVKATTFLKELKVTLVSNKLVHQHLLGLYGHKLQHNVTTFSNLLNNCKNTDKILELVKK